jgi:methionyl-tRNA formyltransferase
MKIIFMGTPDYATNIFKTILDNNFDIVALFTQPDKKVGRKQIMTPPHIKQYCIDNNLNIDIHQPQKLSTDKNIEIIKNYKPDFIVVAAYGQLLCQNILDIAPCINLHASILPKYRGASPIQEAILNKDSITGVTAMKMELGLDTGDILSTKCINIQNKKVDQVFEELSQVASDITIDVLNNFDKINPIKQNNSISNYAKKIKKDNGIIDFENANDIYHKFLAYCYWPNIFTSEELKLKELKLIDKTSNNESKKILEINKDHIVIGCTKGKLAIYKVQPKSKKEMNATDYIRGKRLNINDFLI